MTTSKCKIWVDFPSGSKHFRGGQRMRGEVRVKAVRARLIKREVAVQERGFVGSPSRLLRRPRLSRR